MATLPVLAVHGGCGEFTPERLDPGVAADARRGLEAALEAGAAVLRAGGPALEATIAAVTALEDDEVFNAGRGSVLTTAGCVEMDAAVADGSTGRAGAVAGVTTVRNPVLAARAVMESAHLLLVAGGAEGFAQEAGLAVAGEEWFVTARRREQLETVLALGGDPTEAFGTVGAVAADLHGHVAAATSTGGTTGQRPGRVGDSPVIGAGTWADDGTCAISATGKGEAFVRAAFAHEVDALMRLSGLDLAEACRRGLDEVRRHRGRGGCIAVTPGGEVAMPFTTLGMFRGTVDGAGNRRVALFAEGAG